METALENIVQDQVMHGRWLNTLSYMENCGARLIANYEDTKGVTLDILEHAWEEKRHAYLLKSQLRKIPGGEHLVDYRRNFLLGDSYSKHYLQRLNIRVSRYLKNDFSLLGRPLRDAAYLLVTYAIEVRALLLYSYYQDVLRNQKSAVSVALILREEKGHLQDMEAKIARVFGGSSQQVKIQVVAMEQSLYLAWCESVVKQVGVEGRKSLT
jgi:hypothetical protein